MVGTRRGESQRVLPSSLLSVWKRKGVIWPRYAKFSSENLEVAERLISVYEGSIGKKKKILKAFVGDLEDTGFDYHFVRGLALLLDRRSVFRCRDNFDSVDLRRKIFEATGKVGPATTAEKRKQVIGNVALEFKIPVEVVEEFLYADLDGELVMVEFDPPSPRELLEKYNLSLTQTLLFESTELRFRASANWQRIFFMVKRLGLIYDAYVDRGFWVKLDGPSSLFKLTRRYGTAMAKLLPAVIANEDWTVEAKIVWRYTNEICDFRIESRKHRELFGFKQLLTSYDSSVEQDFASRFEALGSEWHLRREPEPVMAGKKVIIPDFSFERGKIKLYMEVVGFWTVDYLLRKMEKLKSVNVSMLVAVDENLACERVANLGRRPQLNIIYYRNKIPLVPIIRYLQESFKEVRSEQEEFLRSLSIKFTEPFVLFDQFASRIGVSVEAVRAVLNEKTPSGYIALPNGLIRKDTLEKIEKRIDARLDSAGKLTLPEAARIAEKEGVEVTSALEALGYKIVWHGIISEKAEVIKPQN